MKTINYSEKLIDDVKKLSQDLASSTDKETVEDRMRWYLSPQAHIGRLKREVLSNEQIRQNTRPGCKILEIGSGIGTCCLLMRALTGAEVVGVEPAPESYSNLHECINDFKECNPDLQYTSLNCGGEKIPYPDKTFDFIYSFEVLEHVQDPHKVMEEIYRLLKPYGCAYIATCNYDSFYEGHYKQFWNPFIGVEGNRKRYIRKGLSPKFLSELNFITKKKIRGWAKEIGYYSLVFDPHIVYKEGKREFELIYPEGFVMPQGCEGKATWLHKEIESPRVANFLEKFDREYKLYFILTK